jgi:ribosomal protein S18 acetylase RimI-like enzyme
MIRLALPKDLESIIRIDHLAQSDPSRLKFINRVLASKQCYVAEQGDITMGYGALEYLYLFYDHGFVSMLYIDKTYRQQGCGTLMMRYFESICQTEKIFTSTNQSNKPMQALLKSIGYQPSGIIENLDEGDPELVYWKRLNIKQQHPV